MTLGPDGGGTAQALSAKAAAHPIVKRARHMLVFPLVAALFGGRLPPHHGGKISIIII